MHIRHAYIYFLKVTTVQLGQTHPLPVTLAPTPTRPEAPTVYHAQKATIVCKVLVNRHLALVVTGAVQELLVHTLTPALRGSTTTTRHGRPQPTAYRAPLGKNGGDILGG